MLLRLLKTLESFKYATTATYMFFERGMGAFAEIGQSAGVNSVKKHGC